MPVVVDSRKHFPAGDRNVKNIFLWKLWENYGKIWENSEKFVEETFSIFRICASFE